MTKPKRSALGRGLDSLISMDDVPARGSSAINDIPLDQIYPNPDQPRSTFDEDALEELGDECSEEEIRLVRIKFISDMAN